MVEERGNGSIEHFKHRRRFSVFVHGVQDPVGFFPTGFTADGKSLPAPSGWQCGELRVDGSMEN
eukprot:1130168-Prorocentrum_lima.AAC.1